MTILESEALARGQRLVQIRQALSLSRLKFCEKFGFANTTVAQWETLSGVSPGVNERHARRIIRAVESAGLIVSEEWLLHGIGTPPYLLKPTEKPPINLFHYNCTPEKLSSIVEFTLQQLGKNFHAFCVNDDAMQPLYNPADYIIGFNVEKKQWVEICNHKACLATLEDGSQYIRILHESEPGKFLLLHQNPKANHSPLTLVNPKIHAISEIVIHYRWGQC